MRGCGGCLGTIVVVAALIAGSVGTVWIVAQSLREPPLAIYPVTAADSARAQKKIFEAAQGTPEVVLSEREVNAILRRNLGDLPVAAPAARLLGDDEIELVGSVPVRRVLAEPPFTTLRDLLPAGWLERPLWLGIRAHVSVDAWPRRSLRLDVHEFRVGRQRWPVVLLRLTVDPALLGVLRWPLPAAIESVRVEPDRLVIRGGGSR